MLYTIKRKLEFFDDVDQLEKDLNQLLTIAGKLMNKKYSYDELISLLFGASDEVVFADGWILFEFEK